MRGRAIKPIILWVFVVALAGLFFWVRSARLMKSPIHQASYPVNVFAAASLTEAFGDIAQEFESQYPGARVLFNFAGSQNLVLQIEQGADADVFVSADQRWMQELERRNLLASPPRNFVRNSLVVIVPAANPGHINSLLDLARPGIKLVLAAEAVPVGKYSRECLEKLSGTLGFAGGFDAAVLKNVVSDEENVKAVLGKVLLGEADAGIVYQSDITSSVSGQVHLVAIPDFANVIAVYPIAALKSSANAPMAKRFVDFVCSARGQSILAAHHFVPIP